MQGFGETIFAEMSALAVRSGAINLGQGFPDTSGPAGILDAAVDAIRSGANQYPPGPGTAELREAVAVQRLVPLSGPSGVPREKYAAALTTALRLGRRLLR